MSSTEIYFWPSHPTRVYSICPHARHPLHVLLIVTTPTRNIVILTTAVANKQPPRLLYYMMMMLTVAQLAWWRGSASTQRQAHLDCRVPFHRHPSAAADAALPPRSTTKLVSTTNDKYNPSRRGQRVPCCRAGSESHILFNLIKNSVMLFSSKLFARLSVNNYGNYYNLYANYYFTND